MYISKSVETATNEVGVVHRTGYLWLKDWNKSGLEGLMPKFGGGRPSKLTKEQKEQLKQDISEGSWITEEVMKHIKSKYGIDYSNRQVMRILKSFKIHHTKP